VVKVAKRIEPNAAASKAMQAAYHTYRRIYPALREIR
jgi:sugar (pentulose or hexulose) kinase